MISDLQKREFLEKVIEEIIKDVKNEKAQKEIMSMLAADTNGGKMYKYRAFNEYALSNLREGTLYCAVPSSFNDPFDCRMGIDIQSPIEARFEKEFKDMEEYLVKFVQVCEGRISVDTCSNNEKVILHNWLRNDHLVEVIRKCYDKNITDEMLKKILLSNFDIFYDLFDGFTTDVEFMKLLKAAKESAPIIDSMSHEQKEQILSENATFTDFARSFGVIEDADEITLLRMLCQREQPQHVGMVRKLDEDFSRANIELAKNIDRQYRVGSLCTDYKNRLMWSHYADSHKGFCIEYDFSKDCEAIKDLLVLPVVYSEKRTKFPWNLVFTAKNEGEKVKKEAAFAVLFSLLTKDEVWRYENEWRIIAFENKGIGNVKMPPITCVYIGALCNDECKEQLITIAKELNVPIKQMVVDRGEYALHAQNISDSWGKDTLI